MKNVTQKKWKLVKVSSEEGKALRCEDNSIFTEDNEEVLGCSEWLRCNENTLNHIVKLHNSQLKTQ